jgi:hypothetical protein
MPAMTAPTVWKRGFVPLVALLVVVMAAGSARADVMFRKKAPKTPAAESTEAAPTGGEVEGSTEAAPAGEAAAKPAEATEGGGPAATQADDKDFPEAQAQREKARADAALARQMKNAELAKQREEGTPFYQKWEFWTIAGGVVVGSILAIWGANALYHSANGGDVRACPMTATSGCFGQGR